MSLSPVDQVYLDNYLSSIQIVSASSLEVSYAVSDLDFKLISQAQPNQFGARMSKDVLSQFNASHKLDVYRQKAITQQRVIKVLTVSHAEQGGTFMLVLSWRPIYNPESKNMIALLCLSHHLEIFNLIDVFRRVYKTGNLISPRPMNLQLTQREQQVIFFFILNLDSQSIAEILTQVENKTISENSVNKMFTQQLFPKFKVFNRKALYNKLIDCGFSRLMPSNVLDETIVFEITDYIEFN